MAGMLDPLSGKYSGSSSGMDPSNPFGGKRKLPQAAPPMLGSPSIANAAIQQSSQDYDKIMGAYDSLLGAAKASREAATRSQPIQSETVAPNLLSYSQSPALSNAIGEFGNIARGGGLLGNEEADLRARAISPIRSIYANAKRNLDRQKNLQGGYSPNYAAASAKMAREQSSLIGDAATDANARIAEMKQSGRLQAMPQYSGMLAGEEAARRNIEAANAAEMSRVSEGNRDWSMRAKMFRDETEADAFMREQNAIEGMRSLYGTTPANSALYGSQQVQQQQLAQAAQSERNNMRESAWRSALGAFR